MKMLVVEDEPKIMKIVSDYFEKEGWEVYQATDGLEALKIFAEHQPFDTVILDWMLPEKDGLEVCRNIRKCSPVPIIFLTAKTDEIDKLFGLEFGADDYITKPFSLRELATRIRVILRRVQPEGQQQSAAGLTQDPGLSADHTVLQRGPLRILVDEHRVLLNDSDVALTRTEFNLLETLASSPGRVFSRLQLLEKALGEEYAGYERSIDTHILNLRKKIEADPSHPKHIRTVFGIGYKWSDGV